MEMMQFVVFTLCGEVYGANVMNITEIILPQVITRVPNNPDFIEGIIQYRGTVVPILELRKRFHLGAVGHDAQTRFIIASAGDKMIGFVVDSVDDVISLEESQMEEAPEVTKIRKEYIHGVAKVDNRLVILLDLAKVLSVEEQEILEAMSV